MTNSILSQAELNALLHTKKTNIQTIEDHLIKVFKPLIPSLTQYLQRFISRTIEVNGLYIEEIENNLAAAFRQSIYIIPMQFRIGAIPLLLEQSDGQILATTLGSSPVQVISLLSQEFTGLVAKHLSDLVGQWQEGETKSPLLVSADRLSKFKVVAPSYILRLNLEWDQTGLELVMLLGPDITKRVLAKQTKNQPIIQSHMHKKTSMRLTDMAVEPFHYTELTQTGQETANQDIKLVNDVRIEVAVELGSCEMTLGAIMELTKGSVVSLSRIAGEPVDVFVNGRKIAKAEITVLDDVFGVRILEIVPALSRIY